MKGKIFRGENWHLFVLVGIVAIYFLAWYGEQPRDLTSVNERSLTLTSINNAISTAITAVSILLPLLFAIVVLRGKDQISNREREIIKNYSIKPSIYFLLSLVLGAYNLFRLPTMVNLQKNLAYDKGTVFFLLFQLVFFCLGAIFFLILGYKLSKERSRIPAPE